MTETLLSEIEVGVPVTTAYNQWTQLEEFPAFLSDVKSVAQIDDEFTHWVVSVGGVRREFDATIVDQVPDHHIEWESIDGRAHVGRVSFVPVGEDRTIVSLRMVWEPETLLEKAGAALGLDARRVDMDLRRFKEFIEAQGRETGGWRGEIHDGVSEESDSGSLLDVQRPAARQPDAGY